MTSPLITPLNLDDFEFRKTCEFDGCNSPAVWMVWVVHNVLHHDFSAALCPYHKGATEAHWENARGGVHDCGFRFSDELSDNFRAIKL